MFGGYYVRDTYAQEGLHSEFVAEGFAAVDEGGGTDEVEAVEDTIELEIAASVGGKDILGEWGRSYAN